MSAAATVGLASIDRRIQASRALGIAQGLRDSSLEQGARQAVQMLREDRQDLYETEVNPATGMVEDEAAQARLHRYERAIALIDRALGELSDQVAAREADLTALRQAVQP